MISNKTITKVLSVIIVATLATSSILVVINHLNKDDDDGKPDGDGIFDYVSIGASNTNGYGMRGYIDESDIERILNGEVSKDDVNVYGYQKIPKGSYPDLIRDHFVKKYGKDKVTVNQLAISSMRVEELRILLDSTYEGDDYSTWRFTGEKGWFIAAEEGGLDALRDAYKRYISNADLITVDIGWNNFGTYICNQLVDYISTGKFKWNADIDTIFDTEEERVAAQQAKGIIRDYINEQIGASQLSEKLTDIFAYSLLGYMHNFDIVMGKIHELNPDAKVVVIGIQNLLHGTVIKIGDTLFPIGDVFGNFVNMANYHTSSCSAHRNEYLYIKPGVNEHVSVFLDYMKNFDGDIDDLNQNVIDCFNYYDNNIFVQSMVDIYAAQYIESEYDWILSALEYDSGKELIDAGKKNELGLYQEMFNKIYFPALNAAYDTLAQLVKRIATLEFVDANSLMSGDLNIGAKEEELKTNIMNEIVENAMAAAVGDEYVVDIDKILIDDDDTIVAAMYIRFYMGNSFFAHPDMTGHEQIKDAVIDILDDPSSEKEQALDKDLADSVKRIYQLIGTTDKSTIATIELFTKAEA